MTIAALLMGVGTLILSSHTGMKILQAHASGDFKDSYKNYQKVVKDNNLGSLTTKEIIEDLWSAGVIDEQTYKRSLTQIDSLENWASDDKSLLGMIKTWGTSPMAMKEGQELYKTIATYAPYLNGHNAQSYDDLVKAVNNSFYTGLPTIADAPSPQYLDTMFEGTQVEVTDPKKWTAGELAELHNINYDMDYYYDLIKEGTEANKGVGEYTNRQLEALVNSQETKNVTSYLDSIRNAKAEALANGATSGARAAAEILANSEAIAANSQTQAQLANTKAQNMDALLQADAEAKLSARQYFDQLAQSLTTDATNLYTYDVDRYGQEVLTNADLYTADQNLRGARLLANAEMWANQQSVNAQIAANRAAMQAESDQYSWLFNNALRAYGGDTNKALHFVDDYIFKTYQGTNRTTYMNNTNI
jgi:hypothetical protein